MTPIRSYLCDMTNNFRTCGDRKINITMKLTFIPTKDDDEGQLKHSNSNNEKNMTGVAFHFSFAQVSNMFGTIDKGQQFCASSYQQIVLQMPCNKAQ